MKNVEMSKDSCLQIFIEQISTIKEIQSLLLFENMLVPFRHKRYFPRFRVGPSVGFLPLNFLLNGPKFLLRIVNVLRDMPVPADPLNLRVAGIFFF